MDSEDTQPTPPRPKVHGSPRARRISKVAVPVAAVALIVFSFVNVYVSLQRDTLPEEIDGLVLYPDVTYEVVDGPVDYAIVPPPGGPNAGIVQDCGRYRVPVNDENAVASLAVGAVWIAYNPDISIEEVDALESMAAPELYVLLAPYPGLESPIALTAWGAQLEVESSLDLRIPAFLRDFQESEEVPNPDHRCGGGVSIPAE